MNSRAGVGAGHGLSVAEAIVRHAGNPVPAGEAEQVGQAVAAHLSSTPAAVQVPDMPDRTGGLSAEGLL